MEKLTPVQHKRMIDQLLEKINASISYKTKQRLWERVSWHTDQLEESL